MHPNELKAGSHYDIGHKSGQFAKYHRSTGAAHWFSVDGKTAKVLRPSSKKSSWLARAEQDYAQWDKKEEFQKFMSEKMPHLTKGEIDAIGQTLALKKSLEAEKSLSKLIKK